MVHGGVEPKDRAVAKGPRRMIRATPPAMGTQRGDCGPMPATQ